MKFDFCDKDLMNNYVLPLLVSFSAVLFPLVLLFTGLIDGASYVAMSALVFFGYGIYKLHPRIVEFSVGGNSVRLKETLDEADKITNELKELRNISMSYFFSMMSDTTGSHSVAMKRCYDFLSTYNLLAVRKENVDSFKKDITNAIACLLITFEPKIKGHFENKGDDGFIVNVRILHDKYAGVSEEDISSFPAITPAFDTCVALLLLDSIYYDVKDGVPKPVEIPPEIKKYKIGVYSHYDSMEI